jgi:Skp family chaperone for outer membrane proteins
MQEVEQEFSKVEAELECMQQKLAVTKKELDIARSTANETQRTVI